MKNTLSNSLLGTVFRASILLSILPGLGCDTVSRIEMRVVKSESAPDFSISIQDLFGGTPVAGVNIDVRVVHLDHCPDIFSAFSPNVLDGCLRKFTPIDENFERPFPGYSPSIRALVTDEQGQAGTTVGIPRAKYFLLFRVRDGSRTFYSYFLLNREAPTLIITLPTAGGTQDTWTPPSS